MAVDQKKKDAALKEVQRLNAKYGHKAADLASTRYDFGVTSTGVLALDYKLGTGGWKDGHMHAIFGPRDIGKSSSLGIASMRSAQTLRDRLCGVIAVEPGIDDRWLAKHGVDPSGVVVARPDSAEEAFEIALEWASDDLIDHILFDSIGALVTDGERDQDELKSKVGGQSKLITDGSKRLLMPVWKNKKCLIFINQIRDEMNSRIPGQVKMPGGHALEHACSTIVQLKPGKDRYKTKVDGDEVEIGRTVVAVIQRNKLSEGSKQKAQFDFYEKEVEGYPFGIDLAADVIATGLSTGVIQKAGAWYRHDTFPDGRLQGKKGVAEFIAETPEAVQKIRQGVLAKMQELNRAPKTTTAEDE